MISTHRSCSCAIGGGAFAALALAVLPLAACSSTSSGGASSTTSTSTVPSPSTVGPAPSVTGTAVTPSVDTQRLTAIATCLKNANLPTPTSTVPAEAASELVRLLRDPRTIAALQACGVTLPPGITTATS